ncbi:hypothetical protein HDR67_01915 [bacterium]|nr:hypothetical protein [bacterium]
MQQNITEFIIDPNDIEDIFKDLAHKNPFSTKTAYKDFRKEYGEFGDTDFKGLLTAELQAAYKKVKPGDYIYHCKKEFRIAIVKFRIKDAKANCGKSGGWRVVALADEVNGFFYLLALYKHSKGKDDLTQQEKKKVREMIEEYAKSI